MLLTDPRLTVSYTDYGILIPIQPSKVTKVLDHLNALPSLNGQSWKIDAITETISRQDLERVHSPTYLDRLYGPSLHQELLSCYELVDAQGKFHRWDPALAVRALDDLFEIALLHAAGTFQTCKLALQRGFCYFLGGGLHHAHVDRPSGFCLINDLVIAARRLQAESQIQNVWIVDVDAHKGDGTASICHGDNSILTLSIHMGDSWPLDAATTRDRGQDNPSLIASDIDIAQYAQEDGLYVQRLAEGLSQLEKLARKYHKRLPDLVLIVDGSDPYEGDELPSTASLRLSLSQMLERDLLLYNFFQERDIPSAWVNAGGYGEKVWQVYVQFLEKILPERCTKTRLFEN
jgi:acetoin utilization deacetylase AcuC-like enzyme